MKKIFIILICFCILTGCDETSKTNKTEKKDIFAIIDQKFKDGQINFVRNGKLNHESYYANEGWQYVIDDASCIVDIYSFDENSEIYKDAFEKQAIRARDYDNNYIVSTVNKGAAAIIWEGCNKTEEIQNIIKTL